MGVHTEERAWRLGAEGEVRVAGQLDKLRRRDARWRYLHAIPVGDNGADIDHLAVGPGGVFTLNAKHHPNARLWVGGDVLMVNGVRQPYVRNSRHEAARASRLLSAACGFPVVVSGIVVPVDAADITIKKAPSDVRIMNRRRCGGGSCDGHRSSTRPPVLPSSSRLAGRPPGRQGNSRPSGERGLVLPTLRLSTTGIR